jgi:hypothetical protein
MKVRDMGTKQGGKVRRALPGSPAFHQLPECIWMGHELSFLSFLAYGPINTMGKVTELWSSTYSRYFLIIIAFLVVKIIVKFIRKGI